MVLRKTQRTRPTPNDFDPFLDDGQLRKVCIDCYDILDIESFQLGDGSFSNVCESCRAQSGEGEIEHRGPFVGERIAEGFRMMGDDDDDD